jgi:hypothetical protein
MMKKKAKKSKSGTKKGAKKKATPRGKEKTSEEVLNDITERVKSHSPEMADAVIGEGKKGQLATVKFLWEMAKIYPPATDGSEATKQEECLAQTLLRRLEIPETPVVADQYDEDTMVIPAEVAESLQSEGETSGAVKADAEEPEEVPVG